MHNPSTWSERLLATLHREVALMTWTSAGAGDVLTSNGHLHDQLLDLVAGLPTGPRPHP